MAEAADLAVGELSLEGRLTGASNATLRAIHSGAGTTRPCVYKPRAGERPLWDFATGSLGHREVATALVGEMLGWRLVPTTRWREAGPLGPGMCQEWVETGPGPDPIDVVAPDSVPVGWREVLHAEDGLGQPVVVVHEDTDELRRIAILDLVVNNADRKGGHVLRDEDGRLWAIDHGLTFHEEPKLRTVLWGWGGEPLRDDETAALERLLATLTTPRAGDLDRWLTVRERRALVDRVRGLIADAIFPHPSGGWPAIPWPVF